jgi:hypothetical protein
MSEGETKKEAAPAECEITKVGLDGVAVKSFIAHIYHWEWINGEMTGAKVCGTCGDRKLVIVNGGTVAG